jgi:hypothetical protein
MTMPPVHKARSIQKWFVNISVEELDRSVLEAHLGVMIGAVQMLAE